jgi:hypothetical protein
MPARKRGRAEMEVDDALSEPPTIPSMLGQIRNMWEFASLMQYLFFFGKAVKLDDIDVEVGHYSVYQGCKGHFMMDTLLANTNSAHRT